MGGRTRLAGLAVAASATAALAWSAPGNAAVTAPHFINVFPSRDFVHVEGYDPGQRVTVTVHHDPSLISSLSNAGQDASATGTVGSDGIFEVNHVGATCWTSFTPDIRPGDTVSVKDAASNLELDSMVVQNVAGGRPMQTAPDTVVVHGTAQNADGSRPGVAALGSRLINPTRFFANGGKRNLNAPSLTYDGAGTAWTATYAGLNAADIATALSADASATWTVNSVAGTPLEATAHETGANAIAGPTTGCSAPLERVQITGSETNPPSKPGAVTAVVSNFNTVTLDWGAATDAESGVQSYGLFRDNGSGPVEVATVQKPDAAPPAPAHYVDQNLEPGTYTYTVRATDAANNDGPLSDPSNPVTAAPNPAGQGTVNEPPAGTHSIIGFPERDFISADGYTDAATVDVQIIRGGNIVAGADGIVPQGSTGLVEVNHPGGGCWAGTTPYLSAGDIVRTVAKDAAGSTTAIDQTTVANVTAERPVQTAPGTVVVHGTAKGANGGQIPVDQIEQRLVSSSATPFAANGRRTLRAATARIDGTLQYDSATSTRWTATYTGLSPADVTLALSVESRGMWLGRNPATTAEATIFENGDQIAGGPGAPCTAPAAPQPKLAVDTSAYDFGAVDAVDTTKPRGTKTWTVTNNGQQPLAIDRAYIGGADDVSFKVTASTCDGATLGVGNSCTATVTFDPHQAGVTTASLNFADNAKMIGFQSVPLRGTGIAGVVTVSATSLAYNTVTAGTPATKSVTITNTGSAPVNVTPSITGLAAADYAIASSCTQLSAGSRCTINITFNPTATGSRTATLVIPNNTTTPLRVDLSGTGAGSTFTLAPSPVSFGTINRNTTKTQTITVKNYGTIAFRVGAARIAGDAAGVYSVPAGQACIGTTLAAGRTCNLTVNFTPRAAQAYPGTLQVDGDASSLPKTVSATLNGTGK
jgi:hypothetical protein